MYATLSVKIDRQESNQIERMQVNMCPRGEPDPVNRLIVASLQ